MSLALTGVTLAVGLALPASPASAVPYGTYTRQVTGTGASPAATAVCDPGDVVLGGGATHVGGLRPDALVSSRPDSPTPTGWFAQYAGGDATSQISTVALCAHVPAGYLTTYLRQSVSTGPAAAATAVCDPGDVALGGGGYHAGGTRPAGLVALRPSAAAPTDWQARYAGGDATTQIGAVVVCLDGPGPTYTRVATGTGTFAGAFPACDPGDVSTGGGGAHSGGTAPTALVASRTDGTGTSPTGWHARFVGGDVTTQITAVAVCASI
jgi:hypothetical protein